MANRTAEGPVEAMTSKERLLSAIRSGPVDHVPMTIHFWSNPRHAGATWQDQRERLAFYARRSWDTSVDLWCAVGPAPEVVCELHHHRDADGHVLHQIWHTPAGDIQERIRATDDWPEAQQATQCIGLLNDFRPPRYLEVPFKTASDLAALPYLFPIEDPTAEDALRRSYQQARRLADEFQVPVRADLRPGLDWLVWLFSAEEAVLRTIDSPELVGQILAQIGAAHLRRLELLLALGVDCIIRSGWYESADLWSPALFRTYVVPQFEAELRAVRAADVPLVYLMDSGVVPLLGDLAGLAFDCLAGVDPVTAGGTDLAAVRSRLPGKSLWGGISGPLHLGRGTPATVEQAVEQAFRTCGKTGLILGPVVGFRHDWPWENLEALDRAWRRLR